jgi:4-amino-4-deoxy-L-arabinose transferase-like glycosyltransferase
MRIPDLLKQPFVCFPELEREKQFMLLLIVLGFCIRIYNVAAASAIDLDGIEYVTTARDFAQGAFGSAFASNRLPGYPAAIALFHFFIPDIELAGRIVSLASGALLVVLCFCFARRLWGGEKACFVAACVAVHPYMAVYSSRVLAESLATLLFTASLFFFYNGWRAGRSRHLVFSGVLLTLTYLTRPEHIIYFVPLAIVLLVSKDRKISNLAAFLACSLALVAAFLVYLRVHSGFWIIDRKMLFWLSSKGSGSLSYLSGVITDPFVLKNLPRVFYHFCEAVFPPFLVLAVLGFRRTPKPLAMVVLLLIAFHIFGRGLVHHTTKRYSVEFVPVVMVFAGYGIAVLREWWTGFARRRRMALGLILVAGAVSLSEGIMLPNAERQLEKKAGLFLAGCKAGSSVASRLPLVNFYAEGKWTSLESMLERARTCEALDGAMAAGRIEYLLLDRKIERSYPFVTQCGAQFVPVESFRRGDKQMTIYRRRGP